MQEPAVRSKRDRPERLQPQATGSNPSCADEDDGMTAPSAIEPRPPRSATHHALNHPELS
jgi:hypothetical protein